MALEQFHEYQHLLMISASSVALNGMGESNSIGPQQNTAIQEPSLIVDLCTRRRYQGQVQVITTRRYCEVWSIVLTLDIYFLYTYRQSIIECLMRLSG